MQFDSFIFPVFFVVVLIVYWRLRSPRTQNVLILLSSYLFYGWWDYRFLTLIATSTLVDFVVSRRLESSSSPRRRRRLLVVSIVVNLRHLASRSVKDADEGARDPVIPPTGGERVFRVRFDPVRIKLVVIELVRAVPRPLAAVFIEPSVAVIVAGAGIGILALSLIRGEKDVIPIRVDARDGVHSARV